MADAQYQFEVAMGLNQASANKAANDAARAASRIAAETNQALNQIGANPASAAKFAREYGQFVEQEIRRAVRAAGDASVLRPRVDTGELSRFYNAQLRSTQAAALGNQAQYDLGRRGGPRGTYVDPFASRAQLVTSARQVESADRQLADAERALAAALQRRAAQAQLPALGAAPSVRALSSSSLGGASGLVVRPDGSVVPTGVGGGTLARPFGDIRTAPSRTGIVPRQDTTPVAPGRGVEQAFPSYQGFFRAEQVFNTLGASGTRAVGASEALSAAEQRLAGVLARQAELRQLAPGGGGGGAGGGGFGSAYAGGSYGGGISGFGSNFATGFRGRSDRPFAEQLGQAFKFSVFYGTAYRALSAITQTFQQTVQEGIAFQQAVSDLRLATGQTADSAKQLANEVGKEATSYGFSASTGVDIAARAQGIYGTTQANKATQDAVSKTSARVVSQIAFASGSQPADIQANLGAVAQAYGLGPQSQQYIGDLDAYFSKRFGAPAGSTVAATSQAATVGRAAGFSAAEVSAIAADIMARTGATADSTGGYLAQIFSRSGEGSLNTLLAANNISTGGSLQQQLASLATVYKNDPSQRDDISAAFGRGKVQNAVIALLQDYSEVQNSVNDAGQPGKKGATGALDRATTLRLDNIGGQLQVFKGVLLQFANDLSQSGLLDAIGGAVVVFKNIVEAASSLLQVFNELPRPIRDLILGLGALAAASKVAAGSQYGSLLGAATGGRVGRAYGLGYEAAGISAGQRIAVTRAGEAVPLASRAGIGAAGAAALTSPLAVAALVAGGAVAIDKTYRAAKKLDQARTDYLDFAASRDFDLSTGEGNRAAASSAAELAQEQTDAASGFFSRFTGKRGEAQDNAKRASDDAKFFTSQAKLLDDYAEQGNVNSTGGGNKALITDLSDTGIQAAFDAIAQQGGTATQQLNALAASILHTGDASKRAQENYNPAVLAADSGTAVLDKFQEFPGFVSGTVRPIAAGGRGSAPPQSVDAIPSDTRFFTDNTAAVASKLFTPKQLTDQFNAGLSTIKSISDLTDPKTYKSVTDKIVGDLPETAGKAQGLDATQIAGIRDKLTKRVQNQLDSLLASIGNIDNVTELTDQQLTLFTQTILAKVSDELSDKADTDFAGKAGVLRRRIEDARKGIALDPNGATQQSARDLQNLLNQQADNQYQRLEAQRAAAQRNATSQSGFASIGRSFAEREIRSAVNNRSGDTLAKVISQTGTYARDIAVKTIDDARKVAIASAQAEKVLAQVSQAFASGDFFGQVLGNIGGGALTADEMKKVTGPYRKLLTALNETASSSVDNDAYQGDSAASIAAARAAAEAARKGGDLAAGTAAIQQAKADMDAALPGSVAFYNAQAALYTAQQQYAQALIAYHQNQFLLGHDITNPLTQDRAATQAATAQLRADKARGAGADVIAQDRVNQQQAQASQESTAFSQRLSAVQTADELGRISHSKYLSYLQHEHDRLEGITNRTYQQQQQLNQVDQLMKQAADEMQGQFNFGDIKLPTPYEVRRKIAEEAQSIKNPTGQSTGPDPTSVGIGTAIQQHAGQNTYITIDGADTAKVRAILTDVLGKRATTTTTSPRHR